MISENGWKLVMKDGLGVVVGSPIYNFRGELAIITSMDEPPHKLSSEGFVTTTLGRHYAGVYNLKWVKI